MALTNYQKFCGWNQHQFNISPFWWIGSLGRALRVLCLFSQGLSNSRTALLFRGYVVVVPLLSCVWLFATPWTAAHQASLSPTISQSLLKLMSTESVMPSNYFILCFALLLLPSFFPVSYFFQWARSLYQVTKVLELQLQHQSLQWLFRVDFL